jgi:hypothetical protein
MLGIMQGAAIFGMLCCKQVRPIFKISSGNKRENDSFGISLKAKF